MDFDNVNEIITPTKSTSLTISGTGALFIPAGTVGQRPASPQSGYIRFNTTDTVLEYYNGVAVQWQTFGSATLNSLLSVSGTGMLVQTSPGVYAARSVAGTTNRVTITNGDGVAGNPTVDISSAYVGQSSITTLGTIGTGVWQGTAVGATFGGTGQTVYAVGDILAANTTTTLSRVADVATGNALISGGVGVLPSYGKIGLTTHVSGTLPIANGGTNLATTPTNGQLLIGNGTGYTLAGITAGTGVTVTPGAGTITIAATNTGTVTSVSGSGGTTGLTLTGGPITTTGTLTLGGTLAVANGGTGLTTTPANGQIDIGNGTGFVRTTITAGTAISVTNGAGTITLANTGVTSNVAGTGISVSGATGAVTIGNTGVLSFSAGTTGLAPSTATTGAITLSGTLLPANGGTGATATPTNGQLLIGNASGSYTPANITAGTAIGVVNASGSITLNNTGVTSIAGTAGNITASAATGAVTLNLATAGTAGTYATVTTDAFGRVTSGVATQTTATGGTGLTTIGTANQILGVNVGATGLEYKTLTAGANITITPSAGELTIASTGGSTVPGGATTNVQFNNAGAFGGTSNFNYVAGANPQVNILGTDATTQLVVGSGTPTDTTILTGSNNSTVWIEVQTDARSEGLRCYFKRSSAGISGWISYDYDVQTPNIRLTDEDDDPPYIQFNTIGTGTYLQPLYGSFFGARGTYGSRTLGANTGFEWKVGSGATADNWGAASSIMMADSQFLTLPGGSFNGAAATGTTANRPATPAVGMTRYNGTLGRMESFEGPNWVSNIGVIDKSTVPVTATTVAATTMYTFSVPGGTLGTDGMLRLTMNGSFTGGGGTKTCTILVSYGGTTLWSDTTAAFPANTVTGWNLNLILAANNSVTAQTLSGSIIFGVPGGPTTGTAGNFAATIGPIAASAPMAQAVILGTAAFNSAGAGTLLVTVAFSSTVTGFTKNIHILEKL